MKKYLLCKTNVLRWLAMCALLLFAMQHATVNGQPAESSDSLEYISVSFDNTRYLFCKSESRLAYKVQQGEIDSVPQLTFYAGLFQRLASDIYEGLEQLDKQISDPNFNDWINEIPKVWEDAIKHIDNAVKNVNDITIDVNLFDKQMTGSLSRLQHDYELLMQSIESSDTEAKIPSKTYLVSDASKHSDKSSPKDWDFHLNWNNYKEWGLYYCIPTAERFYNEACVESMSVIGKASSWAGGYQTDTQEYMMRLEEKVTACEKEYTRLNNSVISALEIDGFLSVEKKKKFGNEISRNLNKIEECNELIAGNNFQESSFDFYEKMKYYTSVINAYIGFYSVYPVNILIYRDWVKEVLDLLTSIPSDFRNWIIDHGNKLELPSYIWCDGTRYPVIRTDFISLYGWENPMELILPETLKEININCFWDCPNITKVVCLNPEPPVLPERGFVQKTYDTALLVVPDGCMDAYLREGKDLNWYRFKRITEASAAESGITDVEGEPISVFDGEIHLNGTYATIHDLSGRLVYSGNGNKISLPKGCVYILKTKHETMKIIL